MKIYNLDRVKRPRDAAADELDHLKKRMARVKECIDFVNGADIDDKPKPTEDRIDWLMKHGYL